MECTAISCHAEMNQSLNSRTSNWKSPADQPPALLDNATDPGPEVSSRASDRREIRGQVDLWWRTMAEGFHCRRIHLIPHVFTRNTGEQYSSPIQTQLVAHLRKEKLVWGGKNQESVGLESYNHFEITRVEEKKDDIMVSSRAGYCVQLQASSIVITPYNTTNYGKGHPALLSSIALVFLQAYLASLAQTHD
jgi:hypothetical protein